MRRKKEHDEREKGTEKQRSSASPSGEKPRVDRSSMLGLQRKVGNRAFGEMLQIDLTLNCWYPAAHLGCSAAAFGTCVHFHLAEVTVKSAFHGRACPTSGAESGNQTSVQR